MNFLKSLEDAYNRTLRESNGKLNQTDRNTLRHDLMEALASDLDAVMTSDGAVIEMQHEEWGMIPVEVSIKIKDPNFDIDTAVDEYQEKLAKAEAKRLEAEHRAAERKLKQDALKASREAKKNAK